MKGDFSRLTFDRTKHYRNVLHQQGRVQLDADLNEASAIHADYLRQIAYDVIGPCGGPREATGFEITATEPGQEILIGPGRYYVAGLLAENETPCAFAAQPDLPRGEKTWFAESHPAGAYLAYLDVWERTLGAVDDPSLRDPALGRRDTSLRLRTVWQVRIRAGAKERLRDAPGIGRGAMAASTGPSGYTGPENRLYRVEVHRGGPLGEATFKWSRDNASSRAAINELTATLVSVAGSSLLTDEAFAPGQWVELNDDDRELAGLAGELFEVIAHDRTKGQLELAARPAPLPGVTELFSDARHPTLRGWHVGTADHGGVATGVGPIPLENGIHVTFADGDYRTGDYWQIPARTDPASVEWPGGPEPDPLPPRTIEHHRCPLAELRYDRRHGWRVRADLRSQFGPLSAQGSGTMSAYTTRSR